MYCGPPFLCSVGPVEVRMLEEAVPHWSSLGLPDLLALLYLFFLLFCLVLSNRLFVGFVASKPEGRKTAIGEKIKKID